VTDEVVAAFARLVPQLSATTAPPGRNALEEIVGSPAVTVLIARAGGTIVGTLTLAMFPIPTGFRAWIEDVVVDEAARGRGIGEALTTEAIGLARAAGAKTVDLTSRRSRTAAGRLYERAGFEERDTRVYRYRMPALSRGPAARHRPTPPSRFASAACSSPAASGRCRRRGRRTSGPRRGAGERGTCRWRCRR